MADMVIVAGCNGAGKTTITRERLGEKAVSLVWVNPDETTDELIRRYDEFRIDRVHPNLAAAGVSEARVGALIKGDTGFVVETVLASNKYLERTREARERGMSVAMVYVTLETPDLAVERVGRRVRRGGHSVDPQKIIKRWESSQRNLVEFIPLLNDLVIIDNSDDTRQNAVTPFASLDSGVLTIHAPDGLPYLCRILRDAAAKRGAGFRLAGL